MHDEQQRERRNNRIMGSDYDAWKLSNREDEEKRYRARQRCEEDKEDREEFLWECKRDNDLTDPPEDPTIEPEVTRELTEDELAELKHRMFEIEKEMRWEQDVRECQRFSRGY
jgi:hypothetical protein